MDCVYIHSYTWFISLYPSPCPVVLCPVTVWPSVQCCILNLKADEHPARWQKGSFCIRLGWRLLLCLMQHIQASCGGGFNYLDLQQFDQARPIRTSTVNLYEHMKQVYTLNQRHVFLGADVFRVGSLTLESGVFTVLMELTWQGYTWWQSAQVFLVQWECGLVKKLSLEPWQSD